MTFAEPVSVPYLTGERFRVIYHITGQDAYQKAVTICEEQTVEFPVDLLPAGDIPDVIVGQLENFAEIAPSRFAATISYANEIAGNELTQLLNVIFGNTSIKPDIRVEQIELSKGILAHYQGPHFGCNGLRILLRVSERPLLCTALKPMGLSPTALAKRAYEFALGGIDIIKDDHGLSDQVFCPFQERVERCVEALAKANAETGLSSIYMPNITAPTHQVLARAQFAKNAGAGGLLICPGLVGMDTMRHIADEIGLPMMSHPAFQGSFVTSPTNGISHFALYGQLMRLAGADATIFPNYGGRFAFSRTECQQIAESCQVTMGGLKPIFPTPGGGMTLDRIADMQTVYGQEVIYLIGGNLHRQSTNLVESARQFSAAVQKGVP